MRLTFPRNQVERLVAYTQGAPMHRTLYDDPATQAPGLWLAGDEGAYLMSNAYPPPMQDPRGKARAELHVAYAVEANPKALAFDIWWDACRQAFGPSPETRFIALSALEDALAALPPGAPLVLDVTPRRVTPTLAPAGAETA